MASNTAYGVTNSVSKMTGTWFLSLKNLQGAGISESNLDDPSHLGTGFVAGGKGLVKELAYGVTGVVTTPIKRVREQGVGCGQITKGTAQGLFGFITAPANGVFRLI